MTTVQTMFKLRPRSGQGVLALVAVIAAACSLGSCGPKERGRLDVPEVLVAPYDSTRGTVLWAVVPLTNESGASFVDQMAVSDALVTKIAETRGLSCLPLNRTIAAMRALGSKSVNSPNQAKALANALGADGLVVGSITAYDPYNPPKIGLNLALFTRDGGQMDQAIDPFGISIQYSEFMKRITTQYNERPASVVTLHLDGSNHEVLMDLKRYQTGRHDVDSALGWRTALMNMDLYTQFAAYEAVGRLLEMERMRVAQPAPRDAKQAAR